SFFLGSNPTPYDHVMLFSVVNRVEPSLPWLNFGPLIPNDDRNFLSALGGVGWGHVLGDRNVLMTAAVGGYSDDRQEENFQLPGFDVRTENEQTAGLLAVSHFYGIGPATLKYGAEGTTAQVNSTSVIPALGSATEKASVDGGRIYADILSPIGD